MARQRTSRVIKAFLTQGEPALLDGREDNGQEKADEWFLAKLEEVVGRTPRDYDFPQPTWTLERLALVMEKVTGIRVSAGTMSRALRAIGARKGAARARVACPWRKAAKTRRLREIQRMLDRLPRDEVAFHEDEVDIHLNPKIGLDWMNRGQQKEVMTPGKNEKRYVAGARNVRTGHVTYVHAWAKNSYLFIALLHKLVNDHPQARRIHLVLDNYRIHSSLIVQKAVAALDGKIQLYFLPTYCPDHNRIERLWKDLHSNVTRNHQCGCMEELMAGVEGFLDYHNDSLLQPTPLQQVA